MDIHNFTLENGLRVLLIDTKSFPSATALLLVGAGSRYENSKNNGLAHFFEHMAFKGSQKFPSALELSSTVEGYGGVFNAYTAKDHTGYWIKAPSKHLRKSLTVISDMLQQPLLLPEEIEREKGVIIEEINMYEDQPDIKVEDVYDSLLYQNNSLGYPIVGKKETVSAFFQKNFLDYIKSLYGPNNAVLVVAGGFSKLTDVELQNWIKENFENWENEIKKSVKKYTEEQKQSQNSIYYKKTEQAHLILGYRSFSFFDERRFTLSVLSAILGGGMSSRLFHEVRERRGLCYYISTSSELYADAGSINTRVGVGTDINKINEAIKVIKNEHCKLTSQAVEKTEFERAKELIKGHLLLSLEDSRNVASFFGTKLLLKNIYETTEEMIQRIDQVNVEEVQNLAGQLFKEEKYNLALVGPIKKENIRE